MDLTSEPAHWAASESWFFIEKAKDGEKRRSGQE